MQLHGDLADLEGRLSTVQGDNAALKAENAILKEDAVELQQQVFVVERVLLAMKLVALLAWIQQVILTAGLCLEKIKTRSTYLYIAASVIVLVYSCDQVFLNQVAATFLMTKVSGWHMVSPADYLFADR